MALIVKPQSNVTAQAVHNARQFALPVIALGVVIALLYFGRVFFVTSIVATIIAFILEPFVALLVRLRFPRSLASFLVCAVGLLFLYVIGMSAYSQLSAIYAELPKYSQRIADIVDGVQERISNLEDQTYRMVVPARQRLLDQQRAQAQQAAKTGKKSRPQPGQSAASQGQTGAIPPAISPVIPPAPAPIPEVRIHPENTAIGEYVASRLSSFYEILLMISFVPFLVYFMLSWRDHINRSFLHFFHGEDRLVAARSLQGIAEIVRAFVVGNFLLGLILATISSLMFWLMRLSYPLLVGPLSGFLSLVPYVGLPLAILPPLFAALAINDVPVYVLVLVTVAALHLIAMNLLYPKFVGARVHLNPLVVTFSLMVWGFLWDAPGLLLAIPLTAGLKAVCDNVKALRPLGKFLGD